MPHTSADELLASINRPHERSIIVKLFLALALLFAFERELCNAADQAAAVAVVEAR